MPKPTTIPTWATAAVFTDPGELWDAATNKVDPGAGLVAQGWFPEAEPPAEFVNFHLNEIGEWLVWLDTLFDTSDEHTYPTPKTRVRVFDARLAQATSAQSANVPGWFLTLGRFWTTRVDNPLLLLPIGAYLPDGAIITLIRVILDPGVARATVGNRMQLIVDRITGIDFVTPVVPTFTNLVTQEDDGNFGPQVVTSGALSETINKSSSGLDVVVKIQGGNDSGTNSDDVYAFEITYTDPGLLNF